MKIQPLLVAAAIVFTPTFAWSGDKTDAAIGGAAGGAVGAVVGEELGDRNGAIVGAAVGAAVGVAIATDDDDTGRNSQQPATAKVEVTVADHPRERHCPPGQAKKGRC